MERYSIGVTGQIRRGFERSDVQQRIASLFKCSPEQALRLISGQPMTLKTGLERETAERYLQQLLNAGVEPEIKRMAEPTVNSGPDPSIQPSNSGNGPGKSASAAVDRSVSPATPPSVQTGVIGQPTNPAGISGNPSMECPKCGAPQPHAEICIKCGIVIAKFRRNLPDENGATPLAAAEPSELEELGNFVDHNFSAYRYKFQELLNNEGKYVFHWHWPAFFIPFPWFLYRKMYIQAIVLMALYLIPVPFLTLAWSIMFGALGNYLYFRHCRGKIGAVQAKGPDRNRAIAMAGGTLSLPVTILSTILLSGLISFAYFQLVLKDEIKNVRVDSQMAAITQENDPSKKQTLGKMVALAQTLRLFAMAEKLAGKQLPTPESIGDIQRMFSLDAKAVSDHWGTEMRYFRKGEGKSVFLSAGPDRVFETRDDLSHEVQL